MSLLNGSAIMKTLISSLAGRKLLQALLALFVALILLNSTVSVVLLIQVRHDATAAAQEAIKANAKASAGRSKALCNALYGMAMTPAANKLHPVFVNLYNSSGCEIITHKKAN